jgi:hypothetical protein
MSFADLEVKFNQFDNKFKKTEFMSLTTGAHTVRILDPQAKTKPTHFFNINKTTVLCLGDECPVCANNKKLIMQFPDNFRDQPSYNKINYRFFVNVLDKTPAKTCGKCSKEYKNLAMTICTCGEVLNATAPLNKLKVMSKGLTLRDDLDSIDKAILSPNGDPVGLNNYDIVLMVSGAGRDTKVTPVPRTESNEPVVLSEGVELYDLEKVTIELSPSEMLDVQRGVSLKDIFTARKAKATVTVEPVASQEQLDKIDEEVNKLFSQ